MFSPAGSDLIVASNADGLMFMADKHTLVIGNAARLLADAKLLVDHERFASAFVLAVLGLEEIGKVVLELWAHVGPLTRPIERRTSHVRKQAAVGALLLASFAVNELSDLEVSAERAGDLIDRLSKAFRNSSEGNFFSNAQGGILEKTKHLGMYRDDWLEEASLHAEQFHKSDVASIFEIARRAIAIVGDARTMYVGRAIYETSP